MARKLAFVHPRTGKRYERTTDADYTHISIKGGEARWHGSSEAAQRRGGEVYPLNTSTAFNDRRPDAAPVVGQSGPCSVTVGGRGEKCGQPGRLVGNLRRGGDPLYECPVHDFDRR